MPSTIISIYKQLRDDARLQKNWEQNQPRIDRALESVLIARTPREVATAVLLSVKLRFEPAAAQHACAEYDRDLLLFARSQGRSGGQLANLIERNADGDDIALAAALQSLAFYKDRTAPNRLVRLPWSFDGLECLSQVPTNGIFPPALKPMWAERKANGCREIAKLLNHPPSLSDLRLRSLLRDIPGLGPERADATGVFGFKKGWPIVDEYLWRFLGRHGILPPEDRLIKRYDARRQLFDSQWKMLVESGLATPNELAATLYLWVCEAERFEFTYNGNSLN